MATNETLENQSHDAGDENYSNKFNKINRDNETIDHLSDNGQESGGQQQQQSNHIEKGFQSSVEGINGQQRTINAMDQSTDTTGTTTTTTSTSTPNSPPQSMQDRHKQDEMYENDAAKPREDHDGDSETSRNSVNNDINRNICDNDDHDGDDEDEGDEDLEEGELKDDDDDDDDEDDDDNNTSDNRFSNSNNNNNSGVPKDSSAYSDARLHNDPNSQNNPSNYNGPQRPYNQQHQHNRRHFSPNQQHHPGMHHPQFTPYQHQFPGNNNNYRFPPGHDGGMPPVMMPQMNHHPAGPGPGDMYGPRGGPINAGPVQKVNIKCRYYSKTINKCTWGDQCRFRHREDSPSMNEGFDDRPPGPPEVGHMPGRGPPPPPMGGAERFYPTPPMPPQPYGYGPPYEHHPPYGPHQSASPPLPPHSMPPHHWRQQLSPYPASSSSSAHHPESVSPALLPNPVGSAPPIAPNSSGRVPSSQPPSGSTNAAAIVPSPSGAPGFSSSPSSSAVYERKFRLAYESAPWNDRVYAPSTRYDRNDPASGYPPPSSRGGYYRGHYSRDPYGREPIPPHHMGGAPYNYPSGYPPNYPSAYRGGQPPGGPPYASHHRYSSSSQRTAPSDARQSRSNKRARDGESSWSDSGSEDSLLNQAGTSSKSHSSKISRKHHRTSTQATIDDQDIDTSATATKDDADQGGSGTPPGEPLPEDKERQELLLEKLREIEDLMAKKKAEDSL